MDIPLSHNEAQPHPIYDPLYVAALFSEMSATYGFTNLTASLGFAAIWRRFCVASLPDHQLETCCDLMSGMGELLTSVIRKHPELKEITAVDFCPEMCRAIEQTSLRQAVPVRILQEDVLRSTLPSNSFDCVLCSFGLKTFSPSQQRSLAQLVQRLLKPGGVFSFVEISVPHNRLIRHPFLSYIRTVVPKIGRMCLGNPLNYRMLGEYTERFGNAEVFSSYLREEGLYTEPLSHFFGCCTGVAGRKPH